MPGLRRSRVRLSAHDECLHRGGLRDLPDPYVTPRLDGHERGVRGEPASDVDAWARAVVRASEALADPACPVAGFDANPLMLLEDGVVAVDAVVLRRSGF